MIEKLISEYVKTLIITAVLKSLDKTFELNAESAEDAGLEARVTRTYDGVGLSNNRVCEWCLARECTDLPYSEAQALGAFQRHPGCGCVIEYTSVAGDRTKV